MPRPNLKGMDVEALLELRKKVDHHLLQRRSELEQQLTRLDGGTWVVRGGLSKLKGRKVPAKYKGPKGELWAGRGVRPRWLVAAMKGSKKKLSDFLIDKKRA
jgi:DNA-binding protein H-NS